MADIKNLKITEDKTRGKHVADLPVNPTEYGMSAQELQGQFDALPELAIDAVNDLIDGLVENGFDKMLSPQTVGARPNANLLHNWYFGNPVNRNGLSEYPVQSSKSVSIDRWTIRNGAGRLIIEEDGIRLVNESTAYDMYVEQVVDCVTQGHDVCISLLVSDANGTTYCQGAYQDGTYTSTNGAVKTGLHQIVGNKTDKNIARILIQLKVGASVKFKAIKLELGDTQTLARQENGVWVLNEIPDYAEQMAICQQYNLSTGAYIGGSVPLDGSVPMSGDVKVSKSSIPRVIVENTGVARDGRLYLGDDGLLTVVNRKDSSNQVGLNVNTETADMAKLLRLSVYKNGSSGGYNIFGEHNLDLLRGQIGIETLWENASPTSSFKSQNIDIGITRDDYSMFYVMFKQGGTGDTGMKVTIPVVPDGQYNIANMFINIDTSTYPTLIRRSVAFSSSNTVNFGGAKKKTMNSTSYTEDNSYMIPVAIYGIKK
jgi:hypothetical protein